MKNRSLTQLHWVFAHYFWNLLPSFLQKWFSYLWSLLFKTSWSRVLISPVCSFYKMDAKYLSQFQSPNGSSFYKNFQDFFTRKYINIPHVLEEPSWPCEGYICHAGPMNHLHDTWIKGEKKDVRNIFGIDRSEKISDDYYFINIFLHNHNYHRIHSPISGKIVRIHRIPGKLNLLRPWIYNGSSPSEPSYKNERVNIDILDLLGRKWFLSIIGGMGVGSIILDSCVKLGNQIQNGEELAVFLLGSTCCLIVPHSVFIQKKMEQICPFQKIPFVSEVSINFTSNKLT